MNQKLIEGLGLRISGDEILKIVDNPANLNMAVMDVVDGISSVKSYKNIKKVKNPYKSDFKSRLNTTFHKWELSPMIDYSFTSVNDRVHEVDFKFHNDIYMDSLTAPGRSRASARLDRV